MTTRLHTNEVYTLVHPRYQCTACNDIVEKLFSKCRCGKVMIQRGQRKDKNEARDVSIWKSASGTVLLQKLVD
jgi:hypothetical protein